jgi:uncharacterized protein YndB with AHSA1/START domain/DNA-binding transcriptional ArsR family regulator
MDEDRIFKALSDPSRRQLLDLLFQTAGMTLGQLTAHLSMTRFGCMKHLAVLEEAGLVTWRKEGREKLHFINPMPIQHVYERWVSKYAQPWSAMLSAVQQTFEGSPMTQDFTLETYIRAPRDLLWKAITDGKMTPDYYFGAQLQTDLKPEGRFDYMLPDGTTMLAGKVIEINPPSRLVTSFTPFWGGQEGRTTRVIYELEQQGDVCRLVLTHQGLSEEDSGIRQGWAKISSALKTLLETGKPLPVAA